MRINANEWEKELGHNATLQELDFLLAELSLAGWMAVIERQEDITFIKLTKGEEYGANERLQV